MQDTSTSHRFCLDCDAVFYPDYPQQNRCGFCRYGSRKPGSLKRPEDKLYAELMRMRLEKRQQGYPLEPLRLERFAID